MTHNSTLIWSVIVALVVGWVLGRYIGPETPPSDIKNNSTISANADKEIALYSDMRELWGEHMLWTREYIISAVNNSPSATSTANRLMKNQEDIGNAMKAYYGAEAGNKLTALLKDHISIAVEIVAAAKVNDQVKVQDANKRWQDNAKEIAVFLAAANPNWPKATLENMLIKHLTTTADELDAVIKKQYDRSVSTFDTAFDHVMDMADALSMGIIKQFPEKF